MTADTKETGLDNGLTARVGQLSVQESAGDNNEALPPSYEEVEQQEQQQQQRFEPPASPPSSKIPPLQLSRSAGDPTTTTVTPDQCAAHLKFLAVLGDLRDTVSSEDGLFGITASQAEVFPPEYRNQAYAKLREKRWAVYTARAVKRFFAWWQNCAPYKGNPPTTETLEDSAYELVITKYDTNRDKAAVWSRDSLLPPIGKLSSVQIRKKWKRCS